MHQFPFHHILDYLYHLLHLYRIDDRASNLILFGLSESPSVSIHLNRNSFWADVKRMKSTSTSTAPTVENVHDCGDIANVLLQNIRLS